MSEVEGVGAAGSKQNNSIGAPGQKSLSTQEILEIERARGNISAKNLSQEYGISLGRVYRIWRKAKKQKSNSFVDAKDPLFLGEDVDLEHAEQAEQDASSSKSSIAQRQEEIVQLCMEILEKLDGEDNVENEEMARSILDRIRDYTYVVPIALLLVVLLLQKRNSTGSSKELSTVQKKEDTKSAKPTKIQSPTRLGNME